MNTAEQRAPMPPGETFFQNVESLLSAMEDRLKVSSVGDKKKRACEKFFERVFDRALKDRETGDPYVIARDAVTSLLSILNVKDQDEKALFTDFEDLLWKAAYRAKGWEWPHSDRKDP